jgi:hypothetical protein
MRDVESYLRERNLALQLTPTPSNGIGIESAQIALCYVHDPASAGGVLHSGSSMRTMLWPPLVVITSRTPTKQELERFRKQGAVHVAQGVDLNTVNVIKKLIEPSVTDRRSLKAESLPNILVSMEKARVSGLLVVACSHWMGLSVYPWENSSLFYCSANEVEKCRGWAGRMYIVGGNVHHVETPSAKGQHAFTQMLNLVEGSIFRYPLFVSPESSEPLGTVSQCLAKVAVESEQTVPRGEAFAAMQPSRPPPIPQSQSTEPKMTSDLDPLLTSASLTGAIRTSVDGRMLSVSGAIDAETATAVASLGLTYAEQISAVLPLGAVVGVCAGGRGTAFYLRRSKRGVIIAQGTTAQTPTLRLVRDLAKY